MVKKIKKNLIFKRLFIFEFGGYYSSFISRKLSLSPTLWQIGFRGEIQKAS